jgi:outer membrane protein
MKKFTLVFLFFAIFSFGLFAQAIRVAYIDSNRIMMDCVDTREAQRLFQLDRDRWDREIDDMTADIRRLETEFEMRRLTLSESGVREAEERINARIRERQNLLERIYGERGLAASRNEELLAPIMEKLRIVLDRIAIDDNYTIIFDAATSGIVWAQERLDITQQVIDEMNRN